MGKYSIKDIEHLSGIKAHTIRMWEQRYNIIQPKRTSTNIRYYDDADVRRLLNIALLTNHGIRISKIARMSDEEIQKAVIKLEEKPNAQEELIGSLALSMLELDEYRFEKIISTAIVRYGFENTVLDIIYPFLQRVGIFWQTGNISPAQEHFISCLIRQKIIVAIDAQAINPDKNKPRFMLFLPEDEWHEITLLFSNYLLRKRGFRTIYLGQAVPLEDVEKVYQIHQPQYLLCIMTTQPPLSETQAYLYALSESFPGSTILVGGSRIVGQGWELPSNVRQLNKIEDLIHFINAVA